jgi:preprotein translocase subunit YajC
MEALNQFLPLVLIVVVGYFFMIRPQMKRQKDEKKFSAALAKGDRVITKSGMHGKIAELNDKDNSCVIETLAGKIKFDRSAISMEMSQKLNSPPPAKK